MAGKKISKETVCGMVMGLLLIDNIRKTIHIRHVEGYMKGIAAGMNLSDVAKEAMKK